MSLAIANVAPRPVGALARLKPGATRRKQIQS